MVWRNAQRYFELDPALNTNAERLDGRDLAVRRWTLPLFYVVTVVGLAGLVAHRREPLVVLILATMAYFAVSSLLLISVPRLRAPFDLLCAVGVGLAVDAVLRRRQASTAWRMSSGMSKLA